MMGETSVEDQGSVCAESGTGIPRHRKKKLRARDMDTAQMMLEFARDHPGIKQSYTTFASHCNVETNSIGAILHYHRDHTDCIKLNGGRVRLRVCVLCKAADEIGVYFRVYDQKRGGCIISAWDKPKDGELSPEEIERLNATLPKSRDSPFGPEKVFICRNRKAHGGRITKYTEDAEEIEWRTDPTHGTEEPFCLRCGAPLLEYG